MSAITGIEWTDRTWNPTRGCSVISPGCINCYAMKQAHRFSGEGLPFYGLTKQTARGPQWTGVVRTIESALLEPLSWRTPARVFVNSMSDLFHEDVPDAFIDRVFAVMALAPQHTFQILTKRPERMRAYLLSRTDSNGGPTRDIYQSAYYVTEDNHAGGRVSNAPWPLPNVWLGVSVENQHFADERIPLLLQTPAAVRFISYEPALGPVDLSPWIGESDAANGSGTLEGRGSARQSAVRGSDRDSDTDAATAGAPAPSESADWEGETRRLHGSGNREAVRGVERSSVSSLDWVICGGESGPGARPFDLAWARSIVAQCQAAGVACFVKQLGSRPAISRGDGSVNRPFDLPSLKSRKGGDPSEWPSDLNVRQFPEVRT